jgi:hypothetical protein
MKIILLLLFGNILLTTLKEPSPQQTIELVLYSEMYHYDAFHDTLCPNGLYLRNYVNRDTADHNLYLSYGNKMKRKIYCVEGGLDSPICSRPKFAYATSTTIAMFSDCPNSHGLLLMTLFDNSVRTESFSPVYINMLDSILLLQDFRKGKDKFVLTNLDDDKEVHQEVFLSTMFDNVINPKQKAFATNTVTDCFDDIHYANGFLYVTFLTRTIEKEKPELLTKKIKVNWK